MVAPPAIPDSLKDDDGDGVPNYLDKCPNTPPNTKVDAAGCPIKPLVLQGVTFKTNEAVLTPESYVTLDQVAAGLVAHPSVRIEVSGHTDNSGTKARNAQLSQARAESVKSYLVSKGVAADRIVAKGYGSTVPVASNSTADGKAQNRRVEMRILSN